MTTSAPTLTFVRGVTVGQAEAHRGRSGVTVVRFEAPCPTVVDVRGGASGTFDTASLSLEATFGFRIALFHAGGSLYGLDAASGVRTAILESGGGTRVFGNPNRVVPISGAILFDLPARETALPDYARIGYRASSTADRSAVRLGAAGAGAGATVGKYLGRDRSARGGTGSAATESRALGRIGVLATVNAVGAIRDPGSGEYVAGPRGIDGRVVPLAGRSSRGPRTAPPRGTTLVTVVIEQSMPRAALQRVAVYAHDGIASAVDPAHTATDGDVVFVSTTQAAPSHRRERYPGATADEIGHLVQRLVVGAILRAVNHPWELAPRRPAAGRSRAAPE